MPSHSFGCFEGTDAELLAELKRRLDYDRDSGAFFRKPGFPGTVAGARFGSPDTHGQTQAKFVGRVYLVAHLVWLYETGTLPTGRLYRINGDATDDRFGNLSFVRPHLLKNTDQCSECGKDIGRKNRSGMCSACSGARKKILFEETKKKILSGVVRRLSISQLSVFTGISDSGLRHHRERGNFGDAWDGKHFDLDHPLASEFLERRRSPGAGVSARVKTTCAYCFTVFEVTPSRMRESASHYCKKECFVLHRKVSEKNCPACGVPFVPKWKQKTCSPACSSRLAERKKELTCRICERKFFRRASDVDRVRTCEDCRGVRCTVRVDGRMMKLSEASKELGRSPAFLTKKRAALGLSKSALMEFSREEFNALKKPPPVYKKIIMTIAGVGFTAVELRIANRVVNQALVLERLKLEEVSEGMVTRSALARLKSVSSSAVTQACDENGPLHSAVDDVTGKIDFAHPAVKKWLHDGRGVGGLLASKTYGSVQNGSRRSMIKP